LSAERIRFIKKENRKLIDQILNMKS